MSATLKSLGIDQMSTEDRLALLEQLWDSLSADPECVPITEAQKLDLERRLAALDANPGSGSSWDEVKSRLLGEP